MPRRAQEEVRRRQPISAASQRASRTWSRFFPASCRVKIFGQTRDRLFSVVFITPRPRFIGYDWLAFAGIDDPQRSASRSTRIRWWRDTDVDRLGDHGASIALPLRRC